MDPILAKESIGYTASRSRGKPLAAIRPAIAPLAHRAALSLYRCRQLNNEYGPLQGIEGMED
jgi:hypothetical protein